MIIRECPNALCRTPLYTGKCNDECVKRWEREMGVKQKDLVEVVRCKDCKWLYNELDDYCCKSHRGLVRICENSFCSYGERKDNERKAD